MIKCDHVYNITDSNELVKSLLSVKLVVQCGTFFISFN